MLKLGVIALSCGWLAAAAGAQMVSVTLDGQPVNFPESQPHMEHGTLFVPIRGVFEQMGGDVQWDPVQQHVVIQRGSHSITLRVQGKSAMVDNRAVNMGDRAHIENGNVMVPLRFIVTALGCRISWDPASHTVGIVTEGHFIGSARKPARPPVGGG